MDKGINGKLGRKKNFLLLYGSQTGQAQAIAEEFVDKSQEIGLAASLMCLDQVDRAFNLEKEKLVVIITSTTGEGEPPDNVKKFWRRLHRRTLLNNYLAHLNYTLLGLGDSNYTNFCNCGKSLDKRLFELGARRFYPCAWADDAVGLEVAADPWMNKLLLVIQQFIDDTGIIMQDELIVNEQFSQLEIKEEVERSSSPHLPIPDWALPLATPTENLNANLLVSPSLKYPILKTSFLSVQPKNLDQLHVHNGAALPSASSTVFFLPIVSATVLTFGPKVKKTLQLTLDSSKTDWHLEPGDAISVICQNIAEEVDYLLKRLKLEDKADYELVIGCGDGRSSLDCIPAHIASHGASLRYILTNVLDLRTIPKKSFLRLLAEYTGDCHQKLRLVELSSRQGSRLYSSHIRESFTTILDVLAAFPACQPPLSVMLENLQRLQPRSYSITNCPSIQPGRVSFVFNIVCLALGPCHWQRTRLGVCTHWLDLLTSPLQEGISVAVEIPICMRKPHAFHPPSKLCNPIIMIGPGTGVAPFIGFLQQRASRLEECKMNSRKCASRQGEEMLFLPSKGKVTETKNMNQTGDSEETEKLKEKLEEGASSEETGKMEGTRNLEETRKVEETKNLEGTRKVVETENLEEMRKVEEVGKSEETEMMEGSLAEKVGESWLLFGCRHRQGDWLFKKEAESFVASGVLDHYKVAFSRDSGDGPRYVQDLVKLNGRRIASLIVEENADIFICGDAKNMASSVSQLLCELLQKERGMSKTEAEYFIARMKMNTKYLVDVWT